MGLRLLPLPTSVTRWALNSVNPFCSALYRELAALLARQETLDCAQRLRFEQ